MRILVIPSWYPPRGGEFFREHARALAAEGLDVTILACIQTSLGKHGLPAWLWGKGIPRESKDKDISPGSFHETRSICRNIPFVDRVNIVGWVRQACRMAAQWISVNGLPDLIQVHSSVWAGPAAACISKLTGVPYVITEHRSRFVFNTEEARSMFLPWHYPMLREAFKEAACIVTVSSALQPKISELALPSSARTQDAEPPVIHTISNMVDTRFFNPAPRIPQPQPFVFFSLAHLEPVKGFDNLLNAMHVLEQKHPGQCMLVIGGDGSQRQKLKEQTHQLGLHDTVTFCGALTKEEVKAQMQRSHAFVLSSRFEAFGVVFIEAMACGLPVVATRSGGPETFIDDTCGIIVEPDKPEELAMAMQQMVLNYKSFNRNHIWQNTMNSYSPKAIAGQYIRLYEEIVKQQDHKQ